VTFPLSIQSPGRQVEAVLTLTSEKRIQYSVKFNGRIVIEPSDLGLTINGHDLGIGVEAGVPEYSLSEERYATRGWHTEAHNHSTDCTLPLFHSQLGLTYYVEFNVFDDGFAFLYIVPDDNDQITVNGESSSWKLPAGSQVWLAERNNDWKLKSYAGWWIKTAVENLPTLSSQGPVQAPPLVVELPGGGYAALTEAFLSNYSGMRLRAIGDRTIQADFTEGEAGFAVNGPFSTPWRVTLVSEDLNGLVNSDILTNLNPPPPKDFYPDLDFIRPGRSVWRWWSSGTGTFEQEREYVDHAVALGFEYTLVDDGWEDWPEKWEKLRELCAYARERGIGVFVWKDYKGIKGPAEGYRQMREFLDGVQAAGSVGVKIDFMNAESKDRIDFQMAALRETAQRRLMLLFHGCQKPSGESRTYPHEVTREAIRGLELNKMSEGPIYPGHNAALPFTRFLCGHGDYTPLGYSNPGPTTYAHQLATVIVFTSPLQVIANDPAFILNEPSVRPALDVLKSIPSVWDETRVLAHSAIGEVAAFARRSGDDWFLGILNSEKPVTIGRIDLSFLGRESTRPLYSTARDGRGLNGRKSG
jgi:alpha-glucosidase